jgi:hypothetical protein
LAEIAGSASKFREPLAETASEFGQTLGAKDQQGYDEYNREFLNANSEHGKKLAAQAEAGVFCQMMKGRRLYPPEFMPPALITVNRADPQSGRETRRSPPRCSPNRHGLGPAAGAFDQAQAQQIAAVLSMPTPDHEGQSAHGGLSVEVLKADLQKRTLGFGPMNDRAQARRGFVPGQPDPSLL